jgi:glycosyltransferase involved in cell wall biosynthesis
VFTNSALNAPALALIKLVLRGRVLCLADAMGLRSLEVAQTTRWAPARAVYRPLWTLLERLMFASADVVLTVNERHAELIRARHPGTRVRVLRDGAEAELGALRPAARAGLGIPAQAVAVCFVGSLVCRRLDRLLEAWERLARTTGRDGGAALCLVVVGDGPDLRSYRRRADTAGWLGRSVFFLGALPRDDALAAAQACDIAYSDCWSDAGLPHKLYEYMALGLPIVTERRPQMTEILEDGESALFSDGPDDLAVRIRTLADDAGLRARLGGAARAAFLDGHTLTTRRLEFESALAAA